MLQPGINTPTSISGTGVNKRDNGVFQGHLFNAGLSKPQILEALLIKFPQYYLLDISEKIGAKRSLYNNTLNWTIMGRTRSGAEVTAVSNGTTASATLTLDTAYSSADAAGYWLVNDTFYCTNSGARGVVTTVGDSGGFQTITVARPDGTNWSAALIAAGFKIGHTGSSYGEGSSGSGGFRSYLPDQEYNVSTIARRGIKVTRNMMKDISVVGDKWYFKQEDFEQKEFMRDIEATVMFGTRFKASTIGGRSQSRGLLEYAEGSGQTVTFSSTIGAQEADLRLLAEKLVEQNGDRNIVLACGTKIFSDLQSALGNNYRPVPTSTFQEKTGIKVASYEFFGKEFALMHLPLFNDDAIVPQVAASASAKDFRNVAIALDFGSVEGGGRNVEIGYVSEVTQKAISGMASESYEISNAFDGVQMELLAEFMPIVFSPNRLGLLYANS